MVLRSLTSWSLAAACTFLQGGSCQKEQSGGPVPTKEPAAAQVTLEGVDTSALTVREKREWSGYVSKYQAPCADAGTVAVCVSEKKSCAACLPAAKFLLAQVRDGRSEEQVEASYKNRFDPTTAKKVDLDESPFKGPADAAITVVEFADFECPHCATMAPVMKKAWSERSSAVKVVFKFLPLPLHPHADPAARAAVAAWRQGKFWEMHDKLFANQHKLESSDLERYAKEIGLDVGKFRQEMDSTSTRDRIERDKKLSDQLEVGGTPTFYVNGRLYDSTQDLGAWLDTELVGLGLDPEKVKADSKAASAPGAASGEPAGAAADAGAQK